MMKYCCRLVLVFAVGWASPTRLNAQQPILIDPTRETAASEALTETQPAPESADELQAERKDIAEKVRVAQRTLDSARESSDQSSTKPPAQLQREVDLLKQLDVALAQLEAAKSQHADLQARLTDLTRQTESVREVGPSEERPYSFLLLDHLRDEVAARQ
jgi:chromosome segregation ATPase